MTNPRPAFVRIAVFRTQIFVSQFFVSQIFASSANICPKILDLKSLPAIIRPQIFVHRVSSADLRIENLRLLISSYRQNRQNGTGRDRQDETGQDGMGRDETTCVAFYKKGVVTTTPTSRKINSSPTLAITAN